MEVNWSEKELAIYRCIYNPRLNSLYKTSRISITHPDERVKLILDNILPIKHDKNYFEKISKELGPAKALRNLENEVEQIMYPFYQRCLKTTH